MASDEWRYSEITETLHYGPGGWRNDIRIDQRLADHLNATGYVPDKCAVFGGAKKHEEARQAADGAKKHEESTGGMKK